jgi:hypothetical protein
MTNEHETEHERRALALIGNGGDTARDAVMRAAHAYDTLREQTRAHEEKLLEATTALEHRNARIEQLELALAEERARCQALQTERDAAVLERAELHVCFASIAAQIAAFVTPLPPLPSRRRKNRMTPVEEPAEA